MPIWQLRIRRFTFSPQASMSSVPSPASSRQRLFSSMGALFAPVEETIDDYPFAPGDVALLHAGLTLEDGAADTADAIDAQTWDDMLLQPYADRLAPQTSIFGQQMLHRRLRHGSVDPASIARVQTLMADPLLMARLAQACRGLRKADKEVSVPLFGERRGAAPAWTRWLGLLPLGFFVSLALAVVWPPGWLVFIAVWCALMAVQVMFHEAAQDWEAAMATMQQLLRAHSLLGALDDRVAPGFRAGAAKAGKINRTITRSPMDRVVPFAREYGDWLMLKNIRHYFKSRQTVLHERDFLRASFLLAADLDADLALARHLLSRERFCWAEIDAQGKPGRVMLDGVVHPLLADAAPLAIDLRGKGAFISGQNGVGKSTLLRTVGLNLICARAFGFCYADAAGTPLLPVYSCMQSEDTLAGGESLYIAELRRARELLALAEARPALFIIDEIFRGTNHLESVSAAAAVLHTLARDALVIVSSHNLVLASLLEDCLVPLCVDAVEDVVPEQAAPKRRLRLRPGVLSETNGIALLAARGFGGEIEAKAGKVFDWLSVHMAHPPECGHVLAAAP
jgi:hypothetical protein